MDQIGWIRRLHRRENKSEREISRMTGLSRNTVAKWLHANVSEAYARGDHTSRRRARWPARARRSGS